MSNTTTNEQPRVLVTRNLKEAEAGSYYTIPGCGGDLREWMGGYEEWLSEAGIEKPSIWFQTTGASINEYVGEGNTNPFPDDLTVLMFPLEGLDLGRLAIFKIEHGDRWFDDIVSNMRPSL